MTMKIFTCFKTKCFFDCDYFNGISVVIYSRFSYVVQQEQLNVRIYNNWKHFFQLEKNANDPKAGGGKRASKRGTRSAETVAATPIRNE